MAEEKYTDSGSVILAFILGVITGGILGILFAPRSGAETRQRLKDILEDLGEKTSGILEKGKEKASSFIKEEKKRLEEKLRPKPKPPEKPAEEIT